MLSQDRFRMTLHSFYIEGVMAKSHHLSLARPTRHLKELWHRAALHHQRMIATGHEGRRQSLEHALAPVLHRRRLAMHNPRIANHPSAKGLSNRLMAQTNAEDWHLARELPDRLQGDSRFGRRA